jgi:hypothetical protein
MIINVDKRVLDRNKNIIEEDGKEVTYSDIIVRALDSNLEEDKNQTPDIVRKKFMLGTRIFAGGDIELTSEEATMIQRRLCVFSSLIAGQIIVDLDGK